MPDQEITVTAPGRVCLFGEHQDYLHLPVISAAISLQTTLTAKKTDEKSLIIDLPDLNTQEIIPLQNREVPYQSARDYLRSSYNLFIRKGYRVRQGYRINIQSDIPISAGVASSSALVIAWITFLAHIFRVKLSPIQIAELGYQAEVDEFREPGGRMDHYTSAIGGILHLMTRPPYNHEKLPAKLEGIVLGNSLVCQDTVKDLMRVKERVHIGISQIRKSLKDFDLQRSSVEDLYPHILSLPRENGNSVKANIINRDLTKKAKKILSSEIIDSEALGNLLNSHHEQLSQNLGISTPEIEEFIVAAREAGALGCKINGSGFGGCIIAYAPGNTDAVANSIERAGGQAYKISVSDGCRIT